MRYSIPLFALALTAVADPTATLKKAAAVKRDLTTVTSVLAQVNDLTKKLDTAITGYSGDYASVKSAADALNSAVKDGISKVSGGGDLTLQDALGVQAPVEALTKTVQQTVKDTEAKKDTFVSSGHGGDVYKTLKDQKAGADELSKTISGKVPQEVQGLAATLSAGISDALADGVKNYEDQANAPSGGASSGSSSGGASSGSSSGGASSGSSSGGSTAPASDTSGSSGSTGSTGSSSGSTGSSGSASGSAGASGSASGTTDSSSGSSGSSAGSAGGAATTSSPAQFTGAGSVNSFSVVGVLAAVAVVLAF